MLLLFFVIFYLFFLSLFEQGMHTEVIFCLGEGYKIQFR